MKNPDENKHCISLEQVEAETLEMLEMLETLFNEMKNPDENKHCISLEQVEAVIKQARRRLFKRKT